MLPCIIIILLKKHRDYRMGVTNSSFLSPNASYGNVKTRQENSQNPINDRGNLVQEIAKSQPQEIPINKSQALTLKPSKENARNQSPQLTTNQSTEIARNPTQDSKVLHVPSNKDSNFTCFGLHFNDSTENETEGTSSEKSGVKQLHTGCKNNVISLYCDLCYKARTIEYAECFCVTCELFCCTLCASKHALRDKTLGHKFLFDKNMPSTKGLSDERFVCRTHVERHLRYFCKEHALVCCSVCITEFHNECNRLCAIDQRHQDDIAEQITHRGRLEKTNDHQDESIDVNFVKELVTEHGNDVHLCWITDSKVLRNGYLVLIDHNNDCLKIVDIRDNRFVAYVIIGRPNKPWSVCQDYKDNIVVTCGFEIVVYDSITLGIVKMIIVEDWVRGIACDKDLLVYACTSPRPAVRVITRDGLIVNSFELNADGQNLFVCPWYVTISRSRNLLYVSDCGNNYVTCINKRENTQNRYRHRTLRRPQGLTLAPRGKLVICGQGHVIEVAENFKREHVVLEADGYQSVFFDVTNSLFCVSYDRTSRKSNLITILSVTDR